MLFCKYLHSQMSNMYFINVNTFWHKKSITTDKQKYVYIFNSVKKKKLKFCKCNCLLYKIKKFYIVNNYSKYVFILQHFINTYYFFFKLK